jgi:2-C-methyl-D-erythritol 2,4-cyclodiphosphate synthase
MLVADLLAENGYRIVNVDATLIAQRPKIAPFIEQMRENLASALNVEVGQINIKATTEEHLGFTGEGLGMAAHAVCLIEAG